jgi:CheY-like chemotaxis protein
MGSDSESKVRGLLDAAPQLAREQRLPLLEIAMPELKRRPPDYVKRVLATVKALSEADGLTDVFEYLMAKIITQHLWESVNPQSVRMSGRKSIQQVIDKAVQVIAVLALHGNKSDEDVKRAFRAGCESLEVDANTTMPQVDSWADILDSTLAALDRLRPADKSKLVKALIATVMADNRVAVAEMELLRVVCSVIHVPLPMISGGEPDADI